MVKIEYELVDYCRCTKWDEETESEVLDEDGDPVPADWCMGCYEDDKSNLDYDIVQPFIKSKGWTEDDMLYIGGSGVGWQRRSGFAIAKTNTDAIIKALAINGDFTLRFTYEDGEMSAVRYSHDEPMGTGKFIFRLATEEELELWQYR
jgi:hypothetical protein